MTASTHARIEVDGAEAARPLLWTCSRGATIIEYALALALVAAAAISVQSPRLHQVKSDGCARSQVPCPAARRPLPKPTPAAHMAQPIRAGDVPAQQTQSSVQKPKPAQPSAA